MNKPPIDEIYKDDTLNNKVKKKQPVSVTGDKQDINKIIKEHTLLNKQYNKLLVETNTLRKRFAYQENNIKKLIDEVNYLSNENQKIKQRMNTFLAEIEDVYAKLSNKKK